MKFRVLWPFFVCLAFLAFANAGKAQETSPEPAPTRATQLKSAPLLATGEAPLRSTDKEEAKAAAIEVATLHAYYNLLNKVLNRTPPDGDFIFDASEANGNSLGYLSQARPKVSAPESTQGSIAVELKAPSWYAFETDPPALVAQLSKDIDGDKIRESVYIDHQTRIEIKSLGRQVGLSAPISSFYCRGYKTQGNAWFSPLCLSYTKLVSIDRLESTNKNQVQVVCTLKSAESAFGHYLGSRIFQRTITIPVALGELAPSIIISEPLDNTVATSRSSAIRGEVNAPAGILSASVLLNGKPFWSSPNGISAKKLDLDLNLELQPGANTLILTLVDVQGRTVSRQLNLIAPYSKRNGIDYAVIIGVNAPQQAKNTEKASQVRELLMKRGFTVKTLRAEGATSSQIGLALERVAKVCSESDRLILYIAAPCTVTPGGKLYVLPQGSIESKTLAGVNPEQALAPEQFRQWSEKTNARQFLIVLDSGLLQPPATLSKTLNDLYWQASQDFCHAFRGPGRSVLVNLDNEDQFFTQGLLDANLTQPDPIKAARTAYPELCQTKIQNAANSLYLLPMLRHKQ